MNTNLPKKIMDMYWSYSQDLGSAGVTAIKDLYKQGFTTKQISRKLEVWPEFIDSIRQVHEIEEPVRKKTAKDLTKAIAVFPVFAESAVDPKRAEAEALQDPTIDPVGMIAGGLGPGSLVSRGANAAMDPIMNWIMQNLGGK
jgi:hypothetical protein